MISLQEDAEKLEREIFKCDFEAESLDALTVSCEKSLRAKQSAFEARQIQLEEMRKKVAELNSGITEKLAKIFEVEDELVSLERIYEASHTQHGLTHDKLASKRAKLEGLKAKIERQKRAIDEQTQAKETLEKDFTEQEEAMADLAQTLKLNDKMVAGVQSKVYDLIKKKVRLRVDGALASRQYDFANSFVATLNGAGRAF